LSSSQNVKVHQWDRRCLENYLADVDVLADLLQSTEVVRQIKITNTAEVKRILHDLAISQLDEFAANRVYTTYGFESPGIRASEIDGKSLAEIADLLFARLEKVKSQTSALAPTWKQQFVADCEKVRQDLQTQWETSWPEDCNGKRLFKDLYRKIGDFRMSSEKLKKLIMIEMSKKKTSNWSSIHNQLSALL
jgi:hypothetical protein